MLLMGKLTISMEIFNSYVSLPEGILWMFCVLCWKLFRLIHMFFYIYIYMNSHIIHKKHVLWMFCVFLWNYVAGIPIFKSTTSRNKFRILYAILVYIYIYTM